MAENHSIPTCPTCGAPSTRTVSYLRDRRWPESYHVCEHDHGWIVKAGALSLDEFLRLEPTPEQNAEDERMYAESKRLLHRLMSDSGGEG